MGGQRVIKFYGGGQLLCRPSTASSAASYSVRSASKCFEDFEVLVQPVATSETVSGREEELERSEESATIGDTAPKSDRLKVQQEVLRTEEGAEQPEEEDRLGSPCNLATSPPARLSTLTGEASRRVGGETPEEVGWTSEAKLTLGESGPGYMYRMEEGCCCCCSGKV